MEGLGSWGVEDGGLGGFRTGARQAQNSGVTEFLRCVVRWRAFCLRFRAMEDNGLGSLTPDAKSREKPSTQGFGKAEGFASLSPTCTRAPGFGSRRLPCCSESAGFRVFFNAMAQGLGFGVQGLGPV